MQEIRTEFLFTISLDVGKPVIVGPGPLGARINVAVNGGTFEGPKLKGKVLGGGSDWIVVRGDGAMQLDVRCTLETDDGALVNMTYRGIRHGPKEVIERVNRGEDVDPALYYFRTAPFFETASDRYGWLNRIVAVATGRRTGQGPIYQVYQVL
jgi:hypothetical protein